LNAWFAAFEERPSLDLCKRTNNWEKLEPRVIKTSKKSWHKSALAHVLWFEKKWDEAIALANQRDAVYAVVAIVAHSVIAQRPEWVIRASKKQALELMERTQLQYSVEAVEWLGRVKCDYAEGLDAFETAF
jgi:uncharacterized Zn finger protein